MSEAADQTGVVLANLPAGRTERRTALVVGLVLLAIGVLVVPFGRMQLPASTAGAAVGFSLVFLADLITWFLLISQFKIVRSRALLVLASGYLFTGAMNVPVLLTMWGPFSPTGLLGAGLQTSLWLALAGFTGYPLAVFFYAAMKKEPRAPAVHGTSSPAIAASVAIVIAIVLALTWIATAGESHLPKIVWTGGQPSANLQHVGALLLLFAATALLLLWSRRRSVLDQWLMVAMCAWLAQGIAKWIHTSSRWSLSFYVGGWLFVISSTVLLVVLLKETMTLYGRLAVSLVALRRLSAEKLRQSEAYLSEAQRLSHTGSFGWNVVSGEIFWSEETYRIFELDRSVKPTLEWLFERIHPDDRDRVQQTLDHAANEKIDFDIEHRLLMPDSSVKHLHVKARASEPSSGALEFLGAVTDITDRKRAEDALRRSEAYLAEGQKLSQTGTWACNIATQQMIHSSQEHRHLFGLAPEKVGIPPFEEFFQRIHPDDRGPAARDLDRAISAGTNVEAHFRIVLPEGTTRHMYGIGHPLVKPSGETGEFVGAVMDISQRKRDEEKLRRSEESLLEAQRLSHMGSWRRDVASGAVTISPEIYRIFGISPGEEDSKADFWVSRIHPEDRKRVVELVQRSQIDKADYQSDYRIVLPDGSIKHLHAIGHPVLNDSGDIIEFVGTSIDVTAAKQAEETLRRSEAYLAEAQRLSHTGSWAWIPATGEMRYWSEECYRVLGFDPQSGPPQFETVFQRIHPEDQPKSAETVERATRERAEFEMDNRLVHPNGEIRDIHVVGHPVLTSAGDLVEFVGTVFDITERKRAEEERERLRQAQADLARVSRVTTMGELAASLAHEIKQPIAATVTDAQTCLRWLKRDQPDLEEASAAASRIVKDATRAADIISRIRSQFQKGSLNRELVDVNEVIREMIALLQSEAMQSNISVRTELAADLPHIMGDRLQLQQVTMNLIANSIDAMKNVDEPHELVIKSQLTEEEQLHVSVSDTGIGLPAQQADKIFDPFFTTKPHGTGMGLRISRSIVESHGGQLWATSNSGRGATFSFTVPTAAEAVKA